MEKWKFKIDNSNLIDLVLNGKKTATTSLYLSDDKLPKIGELSQLIYDDGSVACTVKTVCFAVKRFKNITENEAEKEGEGDLSLNYYKNVHYSFFKEIDNNFNGDTKVIFEVFKVEDIVKKR
jgi:uncharacterized protein YhfF